MREASKKAKDFFTNFNKEFPSSGSGDSHTNGEAVKKNGNLVELKDEERSVEAGDQNGTDGRSKSELSSEAEDDESRDDVESLNEVLESEDDNVEETPNTQDWVGSLENFFSKALAPKLDHSVTIHYRVKEEAVDEVTVICEIGKLVVEKTEETFKKAKQQAAKSMLDTIENVLESQNDIIKMIVDQKPAPFRDETAMTDEDEYDEDSNDRDVATVPSSDDDGPAPGPAVMAPAASGPVSKSQDTESVPGEMAPGAEYCMALMRTDKPAGISIFYHFQPTASASSTALSGLLLQLPKSLSKIQNYKPFNVTIVIRSSHRDGRGQPPAEDAVRADQEPGDQPPGRGPERRGGGGADRHLPADPRPHRLARRQSQDEDGGDDRRVRAGADGSSVG